MPAFGPVAVEREETIGEFVAKVGCSVADILRLPTLATTNATSAQVIRSPLLPVTLRASAAKRPPVEEGEADRRVSFAPLARTSLIANRRRRRTRRLNGHIAEALRAQGYTDITATHTMLLSNMTLVDDTVTSISHRAAVSAQAVGRLVRELEERGYVRTAADDNDARRRPVLLTRKGRKLMEASFAILADIEEQLAARVGAESVAILRQCLVNVAAD